MRSFIRRVLFYPYRYTLKQVYSNRPHTLEVSIGTKLKAFRLQAGLTQVQLAQAAGILQSALARYEQDQDVPSAPRLVAIAKVLGTTVEEIVDESSLPTSMASPKPLVHGNSTAAQIQKLVQELDRETQKLVLKQVKLMLPTSKEKMRAKGDPSPHQAAEERTEHAKRGRKAA